ncbi:glycosyltransferase [Cesiribacter andamanensis]|uniref:Poly-beta-1,6-N-acetyl-D-glucosamine synthase n=1 Tax=Cesiribacter andamanensis AMV16 TaxID=1279009 RepID=M7N7I9_9BACT|nr:glycosyltransferase [Cesiribacter andamanensis]EMR04573.1 Poly-beta-1,6-N-acetyl-D-glucosamine synthase [Cesiribacter andamanensis AMV16]
MYRYSVIIPVYNRPEELDELLESLSRQRYKNFEVLIIEDGSSRPARHIAEKWAAHLPLQYFVKENTGQGFSRNFGFARAQGEYLVVFDSDCLIPEHYFEAVEAHLAHTPLDAWGGPDRAHAAFTPLQKAISYSMTSPFTTGGIRGGKKRLGAFHPRSFNMGISRAVWEKTGGYIITRMGEDIEFSIRIHELGFRSGLIPEAYVYHKRRTSLGQFYKQLHFFGRARINIGRFFKKEVKLVHLFPAAFVAGTVFWLLSWLISSSLFWLLTGGYLLFFGLIFLDSLRQNRDLNVAFLSMAAAFVQLWAYGVGFLEEGLKGNKKQNPD